MPEHTTHFWDCGCTSAAYELAIEALTNQLRELQGQRDHVLQMHQRIETRGGDHGLCRGCDFSYPCPTVAVYRVVTH